MGLRGDAILQFDWTVEQVTATLERLGLSDNTLIILTSDNGPVLDDGYADRAVELAGTHTPGGPFRGGKYSAFEAGSAVPFIVCWPGHVPQGKTSRALVALTDATASMASLIGASIPFGQATDSRNYLSTWLGKKQKSCPYVVSMAANRSLTLRTSRWKFISASDGPPIVPWGTGIETGYRSTPQLYDMRHDSGERNDVSTRHSKLMKKLQQMLNQIVHDSTLTSYNP